jgi:hypothetical protein
LIILFVLTMGLTNKIWFSSTRKKNKKYYNIFRQRFYVTELVIFCHKFTTDQDNEAIIYAETRQFVRYLTYNSKKLQINALMLPVSIQVCKYCI